MYLIGYALAGTRNRDVVGIDVATSLNKILTGPAVTPVSADPDSLVAAFTAIRSGGAISVLGTSGALKLDLTKGTAPLDVQLFCLAKTGDGKPAYQHTDVKWQAATGKLEGSLVSTCLR
jgi:hypothetical protein